MNSHQVIATKLVTPSTEAIIAQIPTLLNNQRAFFKTHATRPQYFRNQQLQRLKEAILAYEPKIEAALKQDLNKSKTESYLSEIALVLEEIGFMQKNLTKLMANKAVDSALLQFPAKSMIVYEPYGMVLNIAPWNYPFQLSLSPIVGAIAAGNTVVLKPSELAPHTSAVIAQMVHDYFDPHYFAVIEGGVAVNQALLGHAFDYIFFTGSSKVGKIVMQAASQYLTPVTLELGGKSPCIVDASADIKQAAKRIMWGKSLNSGQTCVAPDYLLVHHTVKAALIEALQEVVRQFYGDEVLKNPDYPKMISQRHYLRVKEFLKDGEAVVGGRYNDDTWQISPTVLEGVNWDSPVMQEEIFGAVLPLMTFERIETVIEQINERDKPLALYLFSKHKATQEKILAEISFGGGCINDTLLHLTNNKLPFGGVGASGMGNYHGQFSFYTFSHAKAILNKSTLIDVPLRYPPYQDGKLGLIKKVVG